MKLRTRGRFNVKRWTRVLADRWRGNVFDRAVDAARHDARHSFVFAWNRGLGDVALGLVPLFVRIRAHCSGSRIVVFTRPELRDAFLLAGVDAVHTIAALVRGAPVDLAAAATGAGIAAGAHVTFFADPDPTRWLEGRRQQYAPVLHWDSAWNVHAVSLPRMRDDTIVIGAHVASETAQYYGYVKDWPATSWQALLERFADPPVHWVLFGNEAATPFAGRNVTDLRSRTDFLELLATLRTRCRILLAPDSGVLTAAYYLDGEVPLDIISLWSDPRQGVLKQGCTSPNPRLRHVALRAPGEDLRRLAVDDVAAAVHAALGRVAPVRGDRSDATAH